MLLLGAPDGYKTALFPFATILSSMTHSAAGRAHPRDETSLDPLAIYSRALQEYTLRLWTESLKAVEERRRTKKEDSGTVRHADLKLKRCAS